jgi:selenocysteine-specific elongation factor
MRHAVIGTAGHIDHGKSSLVLALTGTDPDRLAEEKARGITIDLGFAHLEAHGTLFDFVDVPGHERFVKNMLAGATGVDAVLLVVAADESVMPQTREHFEICRLLGVSSGAIALTKIDLADPEMIDVVRLDVQELVAGSFLDGAPIVAVSARTGEGMEALRATLAAVAGRAARRPADGPARLPVDRVFSVRGFGTVVTGTLASGRLRADDEVAALPSGRRLRVRGLQVHGRAAETAVAGQRVAVNLSGIEAGDLARGESLCEPATIEPTRRFDASLELLAGVRPLKHGARVRFHQGTSELLGRVAIARVRSAEGGGVAGEVPSGAHAHVRVRLEQPAVLTRGDRFVLRAYSPPVTIAGGLVLDPHPPRGATRSDATAWRLAQLDPGADRVDDPAVVDRVLDTLLEERGAAGLTVAHLVQRVGLGRSSAAQAAARAVERDRARRLGDLLVAPAALARLEGALLEALAAHHRAHPLSDGLPREEARERLFRRADPVVFEATLEHLAERRLIVARDRLALASHTLSLRPEEQEVLVAVEGCLLGAGLRPPDAAGLPAAVGHEPAPVDQAVALLVRQKRVVKVEGLLFHAEALARLKQEVAALKAERPQAHVDVAAFKERYGLSRKYAIPLLEYLDRERVTRRVGETRLVL